MAEEQTSVTSFGPNQWLVEEMYQQFRENPESVSESWREFSTDYRPEDAPPTNGAARAATPAPAAAPTPTPAAAAAPAAPAPAAAKPAAPEGQILPGAAARIVS